LDVVQELLAAGADDVFHFRMKEALAEAIAGGHWQIVQTFLDRGLDANSPMPFRTNLLGTAVRRGQTEIAEGLLQRGARPLNDIDMLGRTPLLDALHERLDVSLLQQLLDAGSAPDLAWPGNELTPLMIAALHHNLAAVDLLLSAGAKPDLIDKTNQTALGYAMRPPSPYGNGQRDQVIERLRTASARED
jgi:ankyrin repeat protein